MLIENSVKLIGLVGICYGIEIIAGLIAIFTIIYFRNPYIAGVLGSLSSISITSLLILFFLKNDKVNE